MNNTITLIAERKSQKREKGEKTENYCDRIKRIIEGSLTDIYMYETDDVEVTISEKTPILKID